MSEGKTEIYLDHLPRWKSERYKGKINWRKSIGFIIAGIYKGKKFEMKIVDYERNKKSYLTIKYEGKEFDIFTDNFTKCCLGQVLGKFTKEFKIKIGETFKDDKRDITIIDRKYIKNKKGWNDKYYKYKCNKCNFDGGRHWSIKDKEYRDEFLIKEGNLLNQGSGCACCRQSPQIVVENINSIIVTAPWMVNYFKYPEDAKKYTKISSRKITAICPDCGRENKIRVDVLYRQRLNCPSCSDNISYPEKFMSNILKQLNINFETQLTKTIFKWIGDKRYDFYIPSMNLIIEMDGGLGHGKKVYPKSNKTIEETIEDDLYKDRLANEHELEVIRIDCDYGNNDRFKYIKNNTINSELNKKFDLDCINWVKVGQNCEKNLVKEACKIKNNNSGITTVQIVEILNLSRSTIINYLKRGNRLGWCDYNPKEEMRKSALKNGKSNRKAVKIFKDGILLGEYPSCSELERRSEKDFGIKLTQSGVSYVCRGKIKSHKGFTFKYIEENESNILHNQELVQAS